jgi:hypothetical protein
MPRQRQQGQRAGDDEQARLRADHQLAPVHRVRQQPADEQHDGLRNRARQSQEADLERRIGQLVDLPRHRDGGELAADSRQDQPRPKQAKVPLLKRRRRRMARVGGRLWRDVSCHRRSLEAIESDKIRAVSNFLRDFCESFKRARLKPPPFSLATPRTGAILRLPWPNAITIRFSA